MRKIEIKGALQPLKKTKQKCEYLLDFFETEKAIKLIKDTFQRKLAEKLKLQRVSAPKFLLVGTGLQDDLAGTQVPVSFKTKFSSKDVEIVHSLAKWKRFILGKYGFRLGTGLYAEMDAIRKDEEIDEIHSIYVDQWDWELVISKEQRKIKFLKDIVEKIYSAILETGVEVGKKFSSLKCYLPREITFITTDELEKRFPKLSSKEREDKIAEEYGAVFIIGIGYKLKSGKPHDLRAADYDDWKLCGDIIVWDGVRNKSLELTSMGIRVDADTLIKQLEISGVRDKLELEFHKAIVDGLVPLTIGGGIGQSRLCMFLLQKKHIGEVQSSVWPKEDVKKLEKEGIVLL